MRFGFVGLAVLAAVSSVQAVTVDGNWEVVVPAITDTCGLQQSLYRVAQSFTNAFREATGAALPIVTVKTSGRPSIRFGEEAARAVGLLPERPLKDFDNVIAEKGGDIYLFGHDRAIHKGKMANTPKTSPMPTVKAVARFMETYMDVRFLAPGDIGRDVPERKGVEVPDGVRYLRYFIYCNGDGAVLDAFELKETDENGEVASPSPAHPGFEVVLPERFSKPLERVGSKGRRALFIGACDMI